MRDILTGGEGFNNSSGLYRDRQDLGDPVANPTEISWNGYPLPRGLRITDIKPRNLTFSPVVQNWDRQEEIEQSNSQSAYYRKKERLRAQLNNLG